MEDKRSPVSTRHGATADLEAHFTDAAREQRRDAVRSYALAVHLARRSGLPGASVERARERLRVEENAAVLEPALRAMPASLVAATGFHDDPATFAVGTPGATLPSPVPAEATPGLVGSATPSARNPE